MATITRRGKRWSVQIRRKGSPAICRTFAARKEAAFWAAEQEVRLDRGGDTAPTPLLRRTTLADLLDRYLLEVTPRKRSEVSERLRLKKMQTDVLCELTLFELRPSHLSQYRDRRSAQVSAGTVRRELSLLHHAIEIGRREWGLSLHSNPVKEVTPPRLNNARERRLERGEFERLRASAEASRNRNLWPIVQLAIETGMRRGEIVDLSWRHIDLERRTAHIPLTKTDKPRTIPLTDRAAALLFDLPNRSGAVFHLTANALKLAWRRAVDRAGLIDLRFHDLRHEAISRFFELGLSLPEVAVISGHRDARMLMRYTHLRPFDLAQKLRGNDWAASAIGMAASSQNPTPSPTRIQTENQRHLRANA